VKNGTFAKSTSAKVMNFARERNSTNAGLQFFSATEFEQLPGYKSSGLQD
jgi:hypothetical protein